MIENLTKINNVYALVAFIVFAVFVLTSVIILVKKIGKFSFKKGDMQIDLEPKDKIVPDVESSITTVESKTSSTKRSLTEHPFFIDMQKWERRDIPNLKIKSELKRLVVVEFLKIKFRVFRELLRDYVTNAECAMSAGQDFSCDSVQQLFLDGIDKYNDEARKTQIVKNNRIMLGIPEMFLEKFDMWHSPHIEMIAESIGKICNNEIYSDDRSKLLSIIEIFYIAFNLTVIDAIGSINELNGELEKLLVEKLGE